MDLFPILSKLYKSSYISLSLWCTYIIISTFKNLKTILSFFQSMRYEDYLNMKIKQRFHGKILKFWNYGIMSIQNKN